MHNDMPSNLTMLGRGMLLPVSFSFLICTGLKTMKPELFDLIISWLAVFVLLAGIALSVFISFYKKEFTLPVDNLKGSNDGHR